MRRLLASLVASVSLVACQAPLDKVPDELAADLADLSWLDESADPVTHLTLHPATCLSHPDRPQVLRGALLFSSPLLLGGQAAKAGLSCAACHRNGRGNQDFFFAGVSGAPGTADVTHGFLSKIRADQVFNPVPIPDLALPAGRAKVDRGKTGVLEVFLADQIVEEFSGSQVDERVIADLSAYIRAIDSRFCAENEFEAQTWENEINLVRAGLQADALNQPAYVGAMRAALGRVYERFIDPDQEAIRRDLIAMSRRLETGISPVDAERELDRLSKRLREAEQSSLYDPTKLAEALR